MTRLSSRSVPMRRMCPSHCSRLALIHIIISNVLVLADVSCLGVLPVITAIICAFASLIVRVISVLSVHASEPYVRMLHTHTLYSLSFRPRCRSLLFHNICRSLPNRVCVIAILTHTSDICDPPASNIEPRYLDCHAFSAACDPHITFGNDFC